MELVKIVVLGDQNVGKRSLSQKLCDNFVSRNNIDYYSESGLLIGIKEVKAINHTYKFQIWFLNSDDKFRLTLPLYLAGTHGIIIIFDVSNRNSLKNLDKWFELLQEINVKEIPFVIIGNKSDKLDKLPETYFNKKLVKFRKLVGKSYSFFISVQNNINLDKILPSFYPIFNKN